MTDLARALWGIPVILQAERDSVFPTPERDQRYQDRTTGDVYRYDGMSWVRDLESMVAMLPGDSRTVDSLTDYLDHNKVFNLLDYAPVGVTINAGSNTTQTTAAFAAWTAAINAAGGGIAVIPPGTYSIAPTKATAATSPTVAALCEFANLTGFTLLASGATVADANTYTTDEAIFARFTACTDLRLWCPKVTSPVPGGVHGLIAIALYRGCTGGLIDIAMTGGQKAVFFNRETTDPTSYSSSDFHLNIRASGTEYPLLCRFSGNHLTGVINASGCGRNYFAFGVANHAIRVQSVNQTGATIIGAFSGLGCTDVELTYVDTASTTGVTANEAVLLQFSDQTPAVMRNIRVHLDVVNPSGAPFLTTFAINKVDNLGASDTTGRGHVIDGLVVDGYSSQINGVDHVRMAGTSAMASPDVVRGVDVSGLRQTSTGTSNVVLTNLLPPALITYSASMTPDLADGLHTKRTITATNGTAFTINAPTNRVRDKLLTLTISNTSGGALGVATWNAVYKLATWTQPATGFSRSITFRDNGTNLVEISRTPADVPN